MANRSAFQSELAACLDGEFIRVPGEVLILNEEGSAILVRYSGSVVVHEREGWRVHG